MFLTFCLFLALQEPRLQYRQDITISKTTAEVFSVIYDKPPMITYLATTAVHLPDPDTLSHHGGIFQIGLPSGSSPIAVGVDRNFEPSLFILIATAETEEIKYFTYFRLGDRIDMTSDQLKYIGCFQIPRKEPALIVDPTSDGGKMVMETFMVFEVLILPEGD